MKINVNIQLDVDDLTLQETAAKVMAALVKTVDKKIIYTDIHFEEDTYTE